MAKHQHEIRDPIHNLGRGAPDDDNYTAVILPFRNDPPATGVAADAVRVRAIISAGNERRATGYWVDSDRPEMDFKVGETARDLVLAYTDSNKDVWVLDDSRPRDTVIQHLLYETKTRGPHASIGMSVEMVMDGRSIGTFRYILQLDNGIPNARIVPADAC